MLAACGSSGGESGSYAAGGESGSLATGGESGQAGEGGEPSAGTPNAGEAGLEAGGSGGDSGQAGAAAGSEAGGGSGGEEESGGAAGSGGSAGEATAGEGGALGEGGNGAAAGQGGQSESGGTAGASAGQAGNPIVAGSGGQAESGGSAGTTSNAGSGGGGEAGSVGEGGAVEQAGSSGQAGEVAQPAPSIDGFTTSVTSLPIDGGEVTLSWSVTDAESIAIEPGIGEVTGSSYTVQVTASTTFILTATNQWGDAEATRTVEVTAHGDRDWVVQFGSAQGDNMTRLGVDGDGNVLGVGLTNGSLDGPNAGSLDVFAVKYTGSGQRVWIRQLGTDASEYGLGVTADVDNNVIITGLTGGDLSDPNLGSNDVFVAKYSANGDPVWAEQLGTAERDEAYGVTTDADGNIYVTGFTAGALDGPNAGDRDAFLAKYSAAGDATWVRQLGTAALDQAVGVATDPEGNVLIAGFTEGDLDGLSGGRDLFAAKYTSNGDRVWVRQLGTAGQDAANDARTDAAGNLYIAGNTDGALDGTNAGRADALLVKYSSNGALVEVRQFGTTENDDATSVGVDAAGMIFLGGYTQGAFGPSVPGGVDVFLTKYSPEFESLWSRQAGTIDTDVASGLAVDAAGAVFVGGYTDGLFGAEQYGEMDAFLARFR